MNNLENVHDMEFYEDEIKTEREVLEEQKALIEARLAELAVAG